MIAISDAIEAALDGDAVLITGSGASLGATNKLGKEIPTASGLKDLLLAKCGITDPKSEATLQYAAQKYRSDAEQKYKDTRDEHFINLLKDLFTVDNRGCTESQRTLYSIPWIRCYTTNYDNIPDKASPIGAYIRQVDLDDEPPHDSAGSNKKGPYCVCINGMIKNIDSEKLDNIFKLTTGSYQNVSRLQESNWGGVLKQDLHAARAIIIVGLSLNYDLDLSRLLFDPAFKQKTIIVCGKDKSAIQREQLEEYGSVQDMGLDDFAAEIIKKQDDYQPQDKNSINYHYQCFMHNQHWDSASSGKIDPIHNLFFYGNYTKDLARNPQGENTQDLRLIERPEVGQIVNALNNGKRLIILHSNLGNGKTGMVHLIADRLTANGLDYFILKDGDVESIAKEINLIRQFPRKAVVFIEDYYNFFEDIVGFSSASDNISFVLTARTAINETRYLDAQRKLNISDDKTELFDLNKIGKKECESFKKLINEAGLWGHIIENFANSNVTGKAKKPQFHWRDDYAEMRKIVLGLLNSPDLRKRFGEFCRDLGLLNSKYKPAIIIILCCQSMHLRVSPVDILSDGAENILRDPQFLSNPATKDLFDISDGSTKISLRSSLIANHLLQEIASSNEIYKAMKKIAKYCDKQYSQSKEAETSLKSLVSTSEVTQIIGREAVDNNPNRLLQYFQDLSGLGFCTSNAFFWHQYSLACLNVHEYERALIYLNNAYSIKHSKYFVPYMFDTTKVQILLQRIIDGESPEPIADFEEAHRLLMTHPAEGENMEKRIAGFDLYKNKRLEAELKAAGGDQILRDAQANVSAYMKAYRLPGKRAHSSGSSLAQHIGSEKTRNAMLQVHSARKK